MSLLEAIMTSQEVNEEEATQILNEMRKEFLNCLNPEMVLFEYGLEPDYCDELMLW